MSTEENITNLILQPKIYIRRPGSDDLGRDYEIKIMTLLSLRCATDPDTEDMWLGSNMNDVGDFDDIVLCKQTAQDNYTVFMLQLKHQENPSNITENDFKYIVKNTKGKRKKSKEDFSLFKYANSFMKMKEGLDKSTKNDSEIIKYLRKIKKIILVIFTNKGVNKCDFLEKLNDSTLEILNTADIKDSIYKFNTSKLNYDSNFLQQLFLFTNQIHVNMADKIIEKEIKKLLGSSNLVNIDFKEVTNKFVAFIKTWEKGDTESNSKNSHSKIGYILTKFEIINKLIDILLEPYKLNFSNDTYTCYDFPQKHIWNEIIHNKSITLVDLNENVLQYLKDFIGNEIKKYCKEPGKTWCDHVSKKTENAFYKEYDCLNTQMLKIIGVHKKLTMFDIYETLCFNNKIPMLLHINDLQEFNNVMKILKISNYNLKIIIILNENEDLKFQRKRDLKYFINMDDLNEVDKSKILTQPVKIQGRSSIDLGSLVDGSMYKYIKCKDIIQILSNDFCVGNYYESIPEYYIKRSLSKIFLDSLILRDIDDEIFLIEDKANLNDLELGNSITNVMLVEEINSEQINKLKSEGKTIHQLILHSRKFLEWKESCGDIENIRPYVMYMEEDTRCHGLDGEIDSVTNIDFLWNSLEEVIRHDNAKKIRVISASPGMGKSCLLNYVALQVPSNTWVLKISLNEHEEFYENIENEIDYLRYFNNVVLNKYGCINIALANAIFQKLAREKKVVVLLDGFDEISIYNKEQVTRITENLLREGYAVWLTTRSVMKTHLEKNFNTVAITLRPFTMKDQIRFFIKYFTYISQSVDLNSTNRQSIIREFVEQLLLAVRNNLEDNYCQFTGIPLQAELLANIFSGECKISLSKNVVNFNDKFDLLYLYEEFIKKKIDTLCKKFGKDAKRTRIFLEKSQKLFALTITFNKNRALEELNIESQLNEYYNDEQYKAQFLQREGIIVVEQSGTEVIQKFNFNFVHLTFAEYLAAQWLSENINSKEEKITKVIKKILIENRAIFFGYHKFLFKIFDSMLAKGCPLHLAIINKQTKKAEKLMKEEPDCVDVVDKGKRSVLHIISLYGLHHPHSYETLIGIKDKMADLIEQIPDKKIINIKRDLFGFSPLEYGLASWSLAVANKICEKSSDLVININIDKCSLYDGYVVNYIKYCAVLQYKSLFQTLLPYFAYKNLLKRNIQENSSIESYSNKLMEDSKNFNVEFTMSTVSDFFRFKGINDNSAVGENYYYNFCLAAALGTEDNVNHLLNRGVNVNTQDVYCNTPLLYSVEHGRKEMVKLLISKGANVNIQGYNGNTGVYLAAQHGYNEIITELLCGGADINIPNNDYGVTPTMIAFENDHQSTVQLLLSNGADINKTDTYQGYTLLHMAAQRGEYNLALDLVNRGADVDQQTKEGNTAIHLALQFRKIDMAKFLLSKTTKVNKENYRYGCTYLYFAAHTGDIDTVSQVLLKGANINKPIANGQIPLVAAIASKNISLVKLLLSKGADYTAVMGHGNTLLHFAVEYGNIDIVNEFLLKNDINKQNKYGQTPLHLAQRKGNLKIIKLLLGSGADDIVKNENK